MKTEQKTEETEPKTYLDEGEILKALEVALGRPLDGWKLQFDDTNRVFRVYGLAINPDELELTFG